MRSTLVNFLNKISAAALLFMALLALAQACKKDPPIVDDHATNFAPTPYYLDVPAEFPKFIDNSANPLTEEGVALGRMLFYDSSLSGDMRMSCASCHKQEFAFSDAPNAFSTGIDGLKGDRNSMAVFNLAWHEKGFFWDGRANTLEEQAEAPVINPIELHISWAEVVSRLQGNPLYPERFKKAFGTDKVSKENAAKALAQFMRTIVSGESKFDRMRRGEVQFTTQEMQGLVLFSNEPRENRQTGKREKWSGVDCFHCHNTPLFTPENGLARFMNNGSGREVKVPTLRNLAYTAPYLHDGSLATLREVIAHYDKGEGSVSRPEMHDKMFVKLHPDMKMELAPDEVDALLAFLNTLNDTTLLTNKAYSNPFIK